VQRTAETGSPFDAQVPRLDAAPYESPRFEVISLDCEITAYAPDDQPLF
jgi:hypothetical protein